MNETDPSLLVTASGVVHLPSCSHVARSNVHTSRWLHRFDHDRPCKVCTPRFPEDSTTDSLATAPCPGDHAGPCFEGRPDLCADILRTADPRATAREDGGES